MIETYEQRLLREIGEYQAQGINISDLRLSDEYCGNEAHIVDRATIASLAKEFYAGESFDESCPTLEEYTDEMWGRLEVVDDDEIEILEKITEEKRDDTASD